MIDDLTALIREIGERHGLAWEPDASARSMLAKLSNQITLVERRNDFMGRQINFMIPKVRVDEQIQLDEFEIGSVLTWHNKMIAKCEREGLKDRADYHRTRAGKLKTILMEREDEDDDVA